MNLKHCKAFLQHVANALHNIILHSNLNLFLVFQDGRQIVTAHYWYTKLYNFSDHFDANETQKVELGGAGPGSVRVAGSAQLRKFVRRGFINHCSGTASQATPHAVKGTARAVQTSRRAARAR